MAPAGLLLSLAIFEWAAVLGAAADAGLGAGATVVRAAGADFVVRQTARTLLYSLVQSTVVELVFVVVLTAPGEVPVELLLAAVRHAALLAFPAFVQSYCRVIVVVFVAVVVVFAGVAAGVAAVPLQAALLAFPGLLQS